MGEGEDEEAGCDALARQAGSVRHWLIGFFRRRIRSDEEAEDLVQDVFARIVARDSSEPVEHLGAYVVRTAMSVMADRARRQSASRSQFHVPFDNDLHGDDEIDPDRVLCGRQDLDAATAALLSLPERTRTVFVLRRLEGYKYRDIASHLGISVSAVEKHMVKAVRHLSVEMEKRRGA